MGLGMKNVLNIAVFGLSLNSLEQIKEQILLSLPENLNVRWVNLAEQKIDLLLVNDVFFNSPGIQKLLTIQNIVYLRLVKKVENAGLKMESIKYGSWCGRKSYLDYADMLICSKV